MILDSKRMVVSISAASGSIFLEGVDVMRLFIFDSPDGVDLFS